MKGLKVSKVSRISVKNQYFDLTNLTVLPVVLTSPVYPNKNNEWASIVEWGPLRG